MSKVILVTGASRGFGELITKTLSSKGNIVYAAMRDIHGKNKKQAEEMTKWANENKAKVKTIDLDVKNEKSIKEAISKIIQQENKLDVLINNAGIGNYGITESFTDNEIKELFDVNVFGSIKTIKESLPHMRKQKSGLIIQVSSQLGRTVIPLMGLYSGTKFAIEAICESISEEVGDLGIDVCIVQPGGYPTDFANNSITNNKLKDQYGERVKKSIDSMNYYLESLKSKDAPNPQEVADEILKMVEAPQGNRPKRKVVGHSIGAHEINEISEKIQNNLMKMFGIR